MVPSRGGLGLCLKPFSISPSPVEATFSLAYNFPSTLFILVYCAEQCFITILVNVCLPLNPVSLGHVGFLSGLEQVVDEYLLY